jgi:flagellar L-ring protein precursor FlgH
MRVHWIVPGVTLAAWLATGSLWGAGKKRQPEASPLDRYVQESVARGEPARTPAPGSVWTPDAGLGGLGLDLRAAHVDDLITIVVAENASAVASGAVKTQRSSSLNASVAALAKKSNPSGALANLAAVSGASSLNGEGSTSRETTITTTMTARVTRVLPNGYLLVEGHKVVGVNAEEQVITLRGIVRPADLAPDNSVPSDRLAQLEVSVNGKGIVGSTIRRPMFLYRLLLGILPF